MDAARGEGRGVQVTGMVEEFLDLKFLIPRFFWVGKFGYYVFGWLDLGRDFCGYSKQSEDLGECPYPSHVALQIKYSPLWKLSGPF